MRDEVVGVRALEHDRARRAVGLELAAEPVEIGHQREVEQVHRRVLERHRGDAVRARNREGSSKVGLLMAPFHHRGTGKATGSPTMWDFPSSRGLPISVPGFSTLPTCRWQLHAAVQGLQHALRGWKSACPSCGRRVFASLKEAPKTSDGEPPPIVGSSSLEPDQTTPERDIDLGEVDVLAEAVEPEAAEELKREVPVAPRAVASRVVGPRVVEPRTAEPRAVEPRAAEPRAVEPRAAEPRARGRRLEPEPGPAVFHLTAAQVRTLVVEQPSLLETDLAIYRDARSGVVGVDLRTPVGSIDLLARSADGSFVVVAVPDPRDVES